MLHDRVADPPVARPRPTAEELAILLAMEDDTEEAPWMVMNDAQFETASDLRYALRAYAHAHGLEWYVATMLPIRYTLQSTHRVKQVSPDLYVSFVPERRRTSYDVAKEGMFPPFVLEVISPESVTRDLREKRLLYWEQGAREYVLFNPMLRLRQPRLQGHRLAAGGRFEPWLPDETGRLHSEVLGLRWFVEDGPFGPCLRAETSDGQRLLMPDELEVERQREAAAHRHEAAERRQLENEVARLRAELERVRREER